ncbi:MAG: hypothetical protein J0H55_04090 [Chitinophagaceae bacterium]|nr:hypothetical protein [Chitinophagaceae bacterium]
MNPGWLEIYQSKLIEVNNKLDAYTKKMESEGKPIPPVSNGISAKNLSTI